MPACLPALLNIKKSLIEFPQENIKKIAQVLEHYNKTDFCSQPPFFWQRSCIHYCMTGINTEERLPGRDILVTRKMGTPAALMTWGKWALPPPSWH